MGNVRQNRPFADTKSCTPEHVFLSRRKFLAAAAVGGVANTITGCSDPSQASGASRDFNATLNYKSKNLFVQGKRNPRFAAEGNLTSEKVAGRYCNFYEFTEDKSLVWQLARAFETHPWTVEITGAVEKPGRYDLDDIIRRMPIEERVYRLRCVEAWAMVVPWTGFPLNALLAAVGPTSNAKYVRFISFNRPEEAPGQRPPTKYRWPYYEAITIEEAANDLAFIANGIYGHELPKQHGAPIRLVLPWKYGFKSAKAIVKIEFVESMPSTFWHDASPEEYDFWANVNPAKPHPRWSQAMERMIGEDEIVATRPYNGYATYVHGMYKGTSAAAL